MGTFKDEYGNKTTYTRDQVDAISAATVISKCKEQIKTHGFARLSDVIKLELGVPKPLDFYKRIAYKLHATGKYIYVPIKSDIGNDFEIFPIPKKSWKERYWWATTAINITIGLVLGFVFRIVTEPKHTQQVNQKESVQLSPTIPDTLREK